MPFMWNPHNGQTHRQEADLWSLGTGERGVWLLMGTEFPFGVTRASGTRDSGECAQCHPTVSFKLDF